MSEETADVPAPRSMPIPAPPIPAPLSAAPLNAVAPSSPEAGALGATAIGIAPAVALATREMTARVAYDAPSKPNGRRLRWLWWTTGSLLAASLAGLCAYLAVVANQWSDRVDDLTSISQDLGTQVSEQTVARKAAEANAAVLKSQLDTATTRITTLANEEANATDHESVWINLVDSFSDCASGRQELIDVLTNPNLQFDGKSKAQVENELTTYCDGLTTEYTDFKAEIGK